MACGFSTAAIIGMRLLLSEEAFFLWTGHLRIEGSIRWAPVGRQGPRCQAGWNSLVSEFLLHNNTVMEITVRVCIKIFA